MRWLSIPLSRNHGASMEGDDPVQQLADKTAIGLSLTSPGWAVVLGNINAALTTISLVLGIAFLLWRWHRQAKQNSPE